MKKKALYRDILREMTSNPGRFLSIVLMIGLGAFVYAGLVSSGPRMHRTEEAFIERAKMEDVVISSSFGLDEGDRRLIEQTAPDAKIEYLYAKDLKVSGTDVLLKVMSLPKEIAVPVIAEGRLPEKSGEIFLDSYIIGWDEGVKIGDTVVFDRETDKFKLSSEEQAMATYRFTVVGFGDSSDYFLTDVKENSMAGLGPVAGFAYVMPEDFKVESYAMAKLRYSAPSEDERKSEYKERIAQKKDGLLDAFADRPAVRLEALKEEVREKIADGEQELEKGKRELSDAEEKLRDAEKELADGEEKLRDAEETLASEKKKGREKIADAERELGDGRQKIEDARRTLEEKKAELADGRAEFEKGRQEYDEGLVEWEDGRKKWQEGEEKYQEGLQTLEKNRREWTDGEAALSNARADAAAGRAELAENERKLSEGRTQLEAAETELGRKESEVEAQLAAVSSGLSEAEAQLSGVEAQIAQLIAVGMPVPPELEAAKAQILAKKAELEAAKTQLEGAKQQIAAGKSELSAKRAQLEAGEAELKNGYRVLADAEIRISNAEAELQAGSKKLADGERELADAKVKLDEGKRKLTESETELVQAKKKLEDARKELEDGEKKLAEAEEKLASEEGKVADGLKKLADAKEDFQREVRKAEEKLADARTKLSDGRKEYEDGKREYDEKSVDAKADIAKAETDLADARDAMKKLKLPLYDVRDRDDNTSYYLYHDSGNRIRLLSLVFPTFFFFIALLVSLTTLTRMVEERRGQIGTLKALGYSNGDILKKYFLYAGSASLVGGVLGAVIGERLLSITVFHAYAASFIMKVPDGHWFMEHILTAIAIGFFSATGAACFVASKYLRKTSAALMRPKAPKAGSRIFLERIPFFWNRLSFMNKVTGRNMFRYKMRMFMTVFGVTGCVGLIFLGFALRDSIRLFAPTQDTEVFQYDFMTIFDRDLGEKSMEDYEALLSDSRKIKKSGRVYMETVTWDSSEMMDQEITLIVPRDGERFGDFFILRSPKGHEVLKLEDGVVLLTDKLADFMNIEPGSVREFRDADRHRVSFPIAGKVNNYMGHYLFMNAETYRRYFGKEAVYNADFIQLAEGGFSREEIEREFTDIKCVLSVVNTEFKAADAWMAALDIIVGIIIIVSSILAFVVLYNLNNINILERMRELSTVKVLGFYDIELTDYVYRETRRLTFIGILLGFGFGHWLHRFILRRIVPDMLKLYESVLPMTYLISAVVTAFFSVVVMYFVHRRLKKIDMVEALKAYD